MFMVVKMKGKISEQLVINKNLKRWDFLLPTTFNQTLEE